LKNLASENHVITAWSVAVMFIYLFFFLNSVVLSAAMLGVIKFAKECSRRNKEVTTFLLF